MEGPLERRVHWNGGSNGMDDTIVLPPNLKLPSRHILKKCHLFLMLPIIRDCESEESKFRDPYGSEENAREILNSPMEQIREEFPGSPFAQEYYNQLHQQHFGKPTPDDEIVRTEYVLDFADRNVRMRTLNSALLVQRYFFEQKQLGELSREIKPPHKKPPIQSILKCRHSRQVRRENREIKKKAEELLKGMTICGHTF